MSDLVTSWTVDSSVHWTFQARILEWITISFTRGLEDPLEEELATHSSILAWEIPWADEPVGLQSMGLQRVRDD